MHLVVGLGNPGSQYVGTRHNVGFMMLDYIAARHNITFSDSKWNALLAKAVIWDVSLLLLKPETFMNLSGAAVSQTAHYFKIIPENIIVLHDDLDIELGRLKIVSNGGDGGHKGIRSIIEQLGSKDFARIKIGVGRPSPPVLPEKYVLGKFDIREREIIEQRMSDVYEGVRIILQKGIGQAMTKFNQKEK